MIPALLRSRGTGRPRSYASDSRARSFISKFSGNGADQSFWTFRQRPPKLTPHESARWHTVHRKFSSGHTSPIPQQSPAVKHFSNPVVNRQRRLSTVSGTSGYRTPDLAALFVQNKSRYFIKLVDALDTLRPHRFAEAMYEHEFSMEPRRASEIFDAIEELIDRA